MRVLGQIVHASLCYNATHRTLHAYWNGEVTERDLGDSSSGSVGLTDGSSGRREFGPTGGSVAPAPSFVAERSLGSLSRQAKIDRSHRTPDTTGVGADGGVPDDTVLV